MLVSISIILIVALDQISKFLAANHLKEVAGAQFIPGVLSFRYHENKGAAWGMFADQRWVFMIASTVAILGIIAFFIYAAKKKMKNPPLLTVALCFFCGGGIGNMIDRVFLGYVVDFLKFEFIDFPIFNVADSFISIGAVLMVIYLLIDLWHDFCRSKQKSVSDGKDEKNV